MPLIAPKALKGLYFFCEPLAKGSFGVLYVAIHTLTKQKVAVKILDKKALGADAFRIRTEIEALKQLNHKYIYKLYHVVESERYFYLVFEYVPGGELFDYILRKEHLTEEEARVIFRQLVSAIGYVHSKGFAHRDLKPENILLDNDQNIRLIDFGLCAKNSANTLLDTFCGSVAYAAPEVLSYKEYSGNAADMWSLGVILYTLLCGCLPFDPTKPEELPQKIVKGVFPLPNNLSKSSRNLLAQLMCVDPRKRIKLDELCRHPWIVEGFLGHPVDVNEQRSVMVPLNMRILEEISECHHIPKVELGRMLLQRSYDYLMATYMIMESVLETEGRIIQLRRRCLNPISNRHPPPSFEDRASAAEPFGIRNDKLPPPVPIALRALRSQTNLSEIPDLPQLPSLNSAKIPGSPHRVPSPGACDPAGEKENCSLEQNHHLRTVLNTPTKSMDRSNAPELPTLSPSRSMDSQLAQLNQSLHKAQLSDVPFSPRVNCAVLSSDQMLPTSLSGTYSTSFSSTSSGTSHIHPDAFNAGTAGVTRSRESADDRGSNGSGGIGRWQFGRLRDVFMLPKKPQNQITPDGRSLSQRLRKTRHLNNVVLARRGLTVGEVFDKIANALHQESIRFTLKGTGFLCVFSNDWGKTVLSFELELVYVSTRAVESSASASIKRRLTLKPRTNAHRSGPSSRSPTRLTLTAKPRPPSSVSSEGHNATRSRGSSHEATAMPNNSCTTTDSPECEQQIGVKMKRIRGDSFMYTSLCRTILDLADIRA